MLGDEGTELGESIPSYIPVRSLTLFMGIWEHAMKTVFLAKPILARLSPISC